MSEKFRMGQKKIHQGTKKARETFENSLTNLLAQPMDSL